MVKFIYIAYINDLKKNINFIFQSFIILTFSQELKSY